MDGDESKDELLRRKLIPRGPIVVITNSSSCEDVHSAEEEENSKPSDNLVKKIKEPTNNKTDKSNESNGIIPKLDTSSTLNESKECGVVEKPVENEACKNADTKQSDVAKIPQVPARSKLVNGSKMPEKQRIKSNKTDSSTPISSQKKKKSYPTPSVPPRMSKHLPARRTRSDPGTPDQPSRIPRPITNTSRSPPSAANVSPKANAKNNRSPKLNTNKKLKFTESPKSNRNISKTSTVISESSIEAKNQIKVSKEDKPGFEDNFVEYAPEADKPTFEDNFVEVCQVNANAIEAKTSNSKAEDEPLQESNNLIETYETLPGDTTTVLIVDKSQAQDDSLQNYDPSPVSSDIAVDYIASEESPKNPFKNSDTNPFKSVINESKNPFMVCNNPFEKSSEVTPVLHPKGQMSASLNAPPIPER